MSTTTPDTTGLVDALTKAQADIGSLARDGYNKHDSYQFASVDAFLAAANPVMAKHGLLVVQREKSIEAMIRKDRYDNDREWLRFEFHFDVIHTSGGRLCHLFPPDELQRTVDVLFTGAQTFGSAQSYTLKMFLRSLLMIATGDNEDADFNPTETSPAKPKPRKHKS
jgi:hypothetical protein